MGKTSKIITREQLIFLERVAENPYMQSNYFFTGGTPLSYFYLKHRLSEDIDLFTEKEEVELPVIEKFLNSIKKELPITKWDYRRFFGLHTFHLHLPGKGSLKVDFNYYPFPRIEKGIKFKGLLVDSMYDIAVNKIHTMAMKARARDYIDIYFILKKTNYKMSDLLMKAKAKFDWHIDPIHLGSCFCQVVNVKDYPRMLKTFDRKKFETFFLDEARKLEKEIFYS